MKKFLKVFMAIALMCTTFVCGKSDVMAQGEGYVVDIASNQLVGEMRTRLVTTGTKADLETFKSYVIYIPTATKEIVVPMKIGVKGIMQCAYADENGETSGVQMGIFTDAACQSKLSYSSYNETVVIPKASTYYVKFTIPSYVTPANEYTPVSFVSSLWDGRDKLLKNNIWQFSGLVSASKPIYYRVSTTKSGVISFEVESGSSSYVTLCSSTKSALTEKKYVSSSANKVMYAVNKGSYYLKVDPIRDYVRVRSRFIAITDVSGSTKAKARTLTVSNTKKGIIVPGDSINKNDWFKFTLSKRTKINLVVSGNVSSGRIRYKLTSSSISGEASGYVNGLGSKSTHKLRLLTADYLPKGTYYVRFYKDTKQTCGNYNVTITTRK